MTPCIRDRVVLGVTIFTIALGAGSLSWAQEAVNPLGEPTPSSVDQVTTPMERSFKEKPEKVVLFPRLKEELKDAPPFFRDTKLDVNLRTYYFYNNDHVNDTISEAWALGGALSYRSGWFLDRYAEGKYTLPVTDRLGVLLATQFTDKRIVGSDLLTGSSF
jgi:hypothetical protein